jgi:MFS family permease
VVERHLGDIGLYGWIFSAFMLAALAGNVVAGAVCDKAALRGPLVGGAVLFAAGLLLGGLAPTMLVLVLARGVQGFGAGILQVVVNVAVGRGYSEEMRPKMVAATSSAWVLPSLIGPLIAGVVAQSLSWRWVFLGMLLPVAVASWLAYPAVAGLLVPSVEPLGDAEAGDAVEAGETTPTREAEVTTAQPSRENRVVASRAILVAVGAGLFLGGLGDQNNAVRVVLVLVGLALGVPGLIAVLPGRDAPMRSRMIGALAVGALMNLAFFGAEAFMPLTLTSIHHRSATLAGVVLTSASLTWTTASWVQAHWLPRAGARRVAACGMSLVVLGIFGLFLLDSSSTPWWISFVAWVIAGGGMGLAYSTLNVEVLTATSEHRRGESSAALGVLFSLGIAIGTGMGGALLAWSLAHGHGRSTGLRLADLVDIAAAVLGLLGCATLEGRRKPASEASSGSAVCEAPGGG